MPLEAESHVDLFVEYSDVSVAGSAVGVDCGVGADFGEVAD